MSFNTRAVPVLDSVIYEGVNYTVSRIRVQSTTDVELVAAPGAGLQIVVIGFSFANKGSAQNFRLLGDQGGDDVEVSGEMRLLAGGLTGWVPCVCSAGENNSLDYDTDGTTENTIMVDYITAQV